jgi:4-amino-4-deoxy-L-arabinose transferase-like glycosyltransferase
VLVTVVLVVRRDATALHTSDTAKYLELGASLARFDGFATGNGLELFRLPGFPVLIAAASWLGHPTYATIALHALLGALTTWLCFVWAKEAGGVRAGVAGAWLYALEPGQWTWSTLVLSETLFTSLLALSGCAAARYLATRRRPALLLAVAAAGACAYVRLVGYPLPFITVAICLVLGWRAGWPKSPLWRDAAAGLALGGALLGAWHVRNGVQTGYWGFSTQLERAAFIVGRGVGESRTRESYTATVLELRREVEGQAHRPAGDVAAEMRRSGLARIREAPVAFLATYGAGIGATLVHPGSGAVLRLFRDADEDDRPSVTQMLTLGRWGEAWRMATLRGGIYWSVTAAMFVVTLIYVGLFVLGAWWGRRSPAILLAGALALGILALSGGPDGDSRRRAPLVPIMCVAATAVLLRPASTRGFEQECKGGG